MASSSEKCHELFIPRPNIYIFLISVVIEPGEIIAASCDEEKQFLTVSTVNDNNLICVLSTTFLCRDYEKI